MATEEVSKPPSLPPYSEMILAAISSLNEKEGSEKTSISNYIESTYGDLPESHSTLLANHLNRMKESGDLVMVKNNYMLPNPNPNPNPNAPPPLKRGRGRPPKPKLPVPPGTVISPPRPRGRPPKPKDPLAIATAMAAATSKVASGSDRPRGRGRPPKKARPGVAATSTTTKMTTGPPRPRGRPPKVKPQLASVGFD